MEMGRPNCNFSKTPTAFCEIPFVSIPLPLVRSAALKPTWESIPKPIVLRSKNNKNKFRKIFHKIFIRFL